MAGNDHIGDADTVFMRAPQTEAVGSCLGRAFKEVYAEQGYTQVDKAAFDAHMAKMDAEREQFMPGGRLAPLPDGEPEAQDIINAERKAGGKTASMSTPMAAEPAGAKHRGEG